MIKRLVQTVSLGVVMAAIALAVVAAVLPDQADACVNHVKDADGNGYGDAGVKNTCVTQIRYAEDDFGDWYYWERKGDIQTSSSDVTSIDDLDQNTLSVTRPQYVEIGDFGNDGGIDSGTSKAVRHYNDHGNKQNHVTHADSDNGWVPDQVDVWSGSGNQAVK